MSGRVQAAGACRSRFAASILVMLVGGAACERTAAPPLAPPPPLVVLISLDTLRKDAVGAYGSPEAVTPVLDRFAQDAVKVDGARTPVPFTLPAQMSLFTGVAPMVHGVRGADLRLGDTIPTLPEFLRDAGFATHGIAVNYWMKGDFGFARGFDSYQLLQESLRPGVRTTQAALELLDETAGEKAPRFLFLQYFDAHSASSEIEENTLPYYSDPGLRDMLAPDARDPRFCHPRHGCASGFLAAVNAGDVEVAPETLATVRELYGRSVQDLDRQLGVFFEGLRERGLYDDALIVVTSDHGEEFLEHGRVLHSQPYEETLAIPLLVKFPGGRYAGREVGGLVGLTDLLPTLLDVLGLPVPASVQGQSLLPLIDQNAPVREAMLSRDKSIPSRFAWIEGDVKLIHDFKTGRTERYDLGVDAMEQENLAGREPQKDRDLRARLAARIVADRELAVALRPGPQESEEPVLTESERDALRALGYLDEHPPDGP